MSEKLKNLYIGVHNNREARNKALQAKLGFICLCRLCSLPLEQSLESDRRLDEIYRLDGLIGRGGIEGILSSPLRSLCYVDQQVRLYTSKDQMTPVCRGPLSMPLRSLSPMATWQEDVSSQRGRCLGGGRPLAATASK